MAGERFNIVVIYLDDVHYDAFAKMARLYEKAAGNADWIHFPRTYVEYSICGVSRFSTLTGRTASHINCFAHFKARQQSESDAQFGYSTAVADRDHSDHTFPVWLQEAGYTNGIIGKYCNAAPWEQGDTYVPPGFDLCDIVLDDRILGLDPATGLIWPPGDPRRVHAEPGVGTGGTDNGHQGPQYNSYWRHRNYEEPALKFFGDEDNWTGVGAVPYTDPAVGATGREWATNNTHYSTDRDSARIQEWLYTGLLPEPFFVWWAPFAAHPAGAAGSALPLPADRHTISQAGYNPAYAAFHQPGRDSGFDLGARVGTAERHPSFGEADMTDKPPWLAATYPLTGPYAFDPAYADAGQVAAWKTMQSVDEGIYDISQMLAVLPSLHPNGGVMNDNTVWIISNDNGHCYGDHRAAGKTIPYEGSVRTSMFVKYPPLDTSYDPPGPTEAERPRIDTTALTSTLDIAPTICEISGARPSRDLDGMSLVERIMSAEANLRRELLFEFRITVDKGSGDVPSHKAVVSYEDDETSTLYKYVEMDGPVDLYRADDTLIGTFESTTEMYDLDGTGPGALAGDSDERRNITNDPTYSTVKAKLAARLAVLHSRPTTD